MVPMHKVHRIEVIRMFLWDSNSYHSQMVRPYEMFLRQEDLDILRERMGTSHLSSREAAGIANRLPATQFAEISATALMPQAQAEREVNVMGGWGQKRQCFMLWLRCHNTLGMTDVYTIAGFTAEPATSDITGLRGERASIDSNAQFFINSISRITENDVPTHLGTQRIITGVQSSHVLAQNQSIDFQNRPAQKLRPQDVCVNMMTRSTLGTERQRSVLNPTNNVSMVPAMSNRLNAISSNYMAKMVNGYAESVRSAQFGQDVVGTMAQTKALVQDSSAQLDPFMTFLAKIHGGGPEANFTPRDLAELDPTCAERIKYIRVGGTVMTQMPQFNADLAQIDPRNTQHWASADLATKYATAISHAVPALCFENMLSGINFVCHNMKPGRVLEFIPGGAMALSSGSSQMNINLAPNMERFRIRFENEVFPSLTFNNTVGVAINVYCDAFNETRISVSIDGQPPVSFVTPSFADALLAPVTTVNVERPNELATNFETLLDNVLPGAGLNPVFEYSDLSFDASSKHFNRI